MQGRSNNVGDDAAASQFNRMMNQENFASMPFNPILHKFQSKKIESATKEARDKKTSWKSRNFLKVKVDDLGGRVYNNMDVPPAIRYLSSEEIRWKNSESAYNPIKFEGNQFSLPTAYRKRPNPDANHTMLISDQSYGDAKAMKNYNREVSKRIRILKNNSNKFFARYEFDKRLKRNEWKQNNSIENSYKNKLSYLREKELKRGYDILSLKSHFEEPLRERKVSYVKQTFPEKERKSMDGYKPTSFKNVWDKINLTDNKRTSTRADRLKIMKTSNSIHSSDKLMAKRMSQDQLKTSCSIKSNLDGSNRYNRASRDNKRDLRESLRNTPANYYSNSSYNRNNPNLRRSGLSRSLNTIEVPQSKRQAGHIYH